MIGSHADPSPPGPRSQWSEASPLSRCHDVTMTHEAGHWSLVITPVRMTDIAMLVIKALKQRNCIGVNGNNLLTLLYNELLVMCRQ